MQARRRSHEAAGHSGQEEQEHGSTDGRALMRAMTAGFAQELAALREGLAYISDPRNRRASSVECQSQPWSAGGWDRCMCRCSYRIRGYEKHDSVVRASSCERAQHLY